MNSQDISSNDDIKNDSGILVVKDLRKVYNKLVVLDGITLAIEEAKTTVVIGPSGCGKTVFIKHLLGLNRPSDGQVYYRGQRIDNLKERQMNKIRTHFGFLFQGGALFDSLTVAENIVFPIRQHYKIHDWNKLDEVVRTKLELVGLQGFENFYPASLSGGQKKRVALARAIAMNPEIVLYDEPTTGLDPIRADIINELIKKLKKELKITSIVVTHDMKSAYKVGDRILMLHEGKVIADGQPEYIKNHPSHIVQEFIQGQIGQEDIALLQKGGRSLNNSILSHETDY